jgi:hypothetical protein
VYVGVGVGCVGGSMHAGRRHLRLCCAHMPCMYVWPYSMQHAACGAGMGVSHAAATAMSVLQAWWRSSMGGVYDEHAVVIHDLRLQ